MCFVVLGFFVRLGVFSVPIYSVDAIHVVQELRSRFCSLFHAFKNRVRTLYFPRTEYFHTSFTNRAVKSSNFTVKWSILQQPLAPSILLMKILDFLSLKVERYILVFFDSSSLSVPTATFMMAVND